MKCTINSPDSAKYMDVMILREKKLENTIIKY